MNPIISVVMPVYRESKEILKASVFSILNQTLKDFEFIIVIDNPLDKWYIQYLESIKDERIHILVNEKNKGIAESLNRGIKEAKGKYIARMDADDIAHPNRLERELDYLEKNHLDFIGSFICSFDSKHKNIIRYPKTEKGIQKLIYYRNVFSHPTFFFRKEVYERIHGYTNIPYVEDYDFIFKTIKAGFKVGNIPEVLLDYRNSEDGITNRKRAELWVSAELLKKHYRESDENFTVEEFNHDLESDRYKESLKSIRDYLEKKDKAIKAHGLKKIFWILFLLKEKNFRKNISYRMVKNIMIFFRM